MLQRLGEVVFLVHGFNVSRQNGTMELITFGAKLEALSGSGAAVGVLWPGFPVEHVDTAIRTPCR